jgi:outer membrane murein-binding lipoprotein Lpp
MRANEVLIGVLIIAIVWAVLALSGCQTAQKGLDIGTQVYESIEAQKQAEKAAKEKAESDKLDAEQKASAEAKAKEDAIIAAERESEKVYNPPTLESYRKAALYKCVRDGGGPPVALVHAALYNHVKDAYISLQPLKRAEAVAAKAMVQAKMSIEQGEYPIADRGNGGKVHIRAKQSGLTGPAFFIVVDEQGTHWCTHIPDLGKRWGSQHPSDPSPFGGPIQAEWVGVIK